MRHARFGSTPDRATRPARPRRDRRGALILTVLALASPVLRAQSSERLQRSFRDVTLGADFASVDEAVQRDTLFAYRGEPDISLRISDGERVIDTRGRTFVDRAIFQFQQDALYTFSLYLNRRTLDYFQVFEQLRARYGEPILLDPSRAVWQDEFTRIEVERPLTVHYLDLATFEALRAERRRIEAAGDLARDAFLEEF